MAQTQAEPWLVERARCSAGSPWRRLLAITALLGVCSLGCSNSKRNPHGESGRGGETSAAGQDGAAAVSGADVTNNGGAAGGDDGDDGSLSDAQIISVMFAANARVLQLAGLPSSQTATTSVHAFAERMVEEQSAATERLVMLGYRLQLVPEDCTLSREIGESAAESFDQLQAESGGDFDTAYARSQVADNTDTGAIIEQRLLPEVQDHTLREEVLTFEAVALAHREEAQVLLDGLSRP